MSNKKSPIPKSYPVATSVFGASTLIWLALQLGVEIPADVAVEMVGFLSLAVAFFTQRTMQDNL